MKKIKNIIIAGFFALVAFSCQKTIELAPID